LQIKTKIVSRLTADSRPVKQEFNGTVILPPLVFPASRDRQGRAVELRWLAKSGNVTHHFILMVDADPVFEQGLDDVDVTLGGGTLQRGVAGLKDGKRISFLGTTF